MAGIPEHLLKRAQEAREKAAAEAAGASSPTVASSDAGSRIPADLLERSKAAGGAVAVAEKPSALVVGVPTN